MIIANFCKTEIYKNLYGGLWQWDYGQVLRIQGLDLPTAVEVHFSLQEKGGEAVTRVGTTKNGATDVVIPDSMLENNGSAADYFIYAFIYLTDETSGQTEYKISMKVKARPKPEAFDSPEDAELFREAIAAVNAAADRAETAEKEAEGWAHGREDMPEKAEDNAKYYAGEAAKDAEQTSADRKEVERLVESVAGIDEDVELVRGYKEAAEKAAGNAATSAQASEESRKASETAKTAAEAAQTKAEEAARKTAEDRTAVEQAKTDVEGMKNQVAEDKTSIEQTVYGFELTAQQAVTAVNNAGQAQTERVQGTGNTAVQDIQTAKEQAVQNVETAGTQQVQAVQTEGTTQIGAVQQKGQEVLDSIPEDFTTQMAGKLDKNQGAENSGKVLVVGGDGTVTPGETPIKVDSTLTQSGQAADAKATGDTITALAIKNQASGAVPIIITDSAEYPIQDLEMEGWTEQQSTTGAQILPFPDKEKESVVLNGITYTFNADESITVRGTATERSYIKLLNYTEKVKLPKNNYVISVGVELPSGCRVLVDEYSENNDYIRTLSDISAGYTSKTFAVSEESGNIDAYFDIDSGNTVNLTIYPMLNAGSEALPYEPYTGNQPSPSPDYPQEIINAGKYNEETQKWEYEVKLTGANLFDAKKYVELNSKYYEIGPNGGVIQTVDDGRGVGSISVVHTLPPGTFYIRGDKSYGQVIIDGASFIMSDPGSYAILTLKKETDIAYKFYMSSDTSYPSEEYFPMVSRVQDATYEPYRTPQTVLLQSDRPLTKWDRLEKRGGQWGWVFKSAEIEFDGSEDENWWISVKNNYQTFGFTKTDVAGTGGYCDKFIDNKMVASSSGNVIGVSCLTAQRIYVANGVSEELTEFKTWLQSNPLTVWYETAEETFVPLTEAEQSALNALHTNYPTTVLVNDQGCEMSLEYVADTKNYIDQKIQETIQQSIAGNLLSTNGSQALSAPMGAALNLRLEALEAKAE